MDTFCNCEHQNHWPADYVIEMDGETIPMPGGLNDGTFHEYMKVPAGEKKAMFVGLICDDCAVRCMSTCLV